ncbi:hypothetical protein V8Z80_03255 [Orrella sp. JC864]|uniref:hypothetical protein n=1 Tax=Orrella sp. JC864 TaxID=3120298 RepID=UPI003009B942
MSSMQTFAPGASPLPPAKILAMLDGMLPGLAVLHESGRLHGGIVPDAVEIDAEGWARLRPPGGDPRPADPVLPLGAGLAPGYAALEQYLDDPAQPLGPWTDVYALSALVCAWITGSPPPPAPERVVQDTWVPLGQRGLHEVPPALLQAVDRGLLLFPQERARSLADYEHALQVCAQGEPAPPAAAARAKAGNAAAAAQAPRSSAAAAAAASASAPAPAPAQPAARPAPAAPADAGQRPEPAPAPAQRAPWGLVVAVLALLAGTAAWWLLGRDTAPDPSAQAAGQAMTAPAPGDAEPVPPAAHAGEQPAAPAAPPPAAAQDPAPALAADAPAMQDPAPDAGQAPQPPALAHVPPAPEQAPAQPGEPDPAGAALAAGQPAPSDALSPPLPAPSAASADGAAAQAPAPEQAETAHEAGGPQAAQLEATEQAAAEQAAMEQAAMEHADRALTALEPGETGQQADAQATPEPPAPAPVRVSIDVQPWGEILVDGISRGISPPLRSLQLAPGTYAVTVRNADLPPHNVQLTVRPGQPASISHRF